MSLRTQLLAITLAAALVVGAAIAQGSQDAEPSIADILRGHDDLGTFTELMDATGLLDDFAQPGLFTVFAPTDAAFDALPEDVMAEIVGREGVINSVLRNHISIGSSGADALARMNAMTNLEGYQFMLVQRGEQLWVSGATVTERDLRGSNGVVHVIDTVLLPEHHFPKKDSVTIPAGGTTGGSP